MVRQSSGLIWIPRATSTFDVSSPEAVCKRGPADRARGARKAVSFVPIIVGDDVLTSLVVVRRQANRVSTPDCDRDT
jgi:hypothetical protein